MINTTGQKIKELREKAGLSQTHIAQFLGMDQSTISKCEKGERQFQVDHLERLGSLFGISLGDLMNEDMSVVPLQIAFPLLLANLTQWLAPGSAGEIPTQVAPGDPVTLNVPAIDSNGLAISEVTITHPDNSITRQAVESGQVVFSETTQPGLYRINFTASNSIDQSGSILFAVNLFSPQESAIDPADNLPITGVSAAGGQSTSEQRARREWWRPWALLALALLCIEWLVYQRNALAFLVNSFRQRWHSLRSVSR